MSVHSKTARAARRRVASRFRPGVEWQGARTTPAALSVNDFLDRTTVDAVLSLREAVLLVNNGGNAIAAFGRNLTAGEQSRIVGSFGGGDGILFAPRSRPPRPSRSPAVSRS